MRSSTRTHPAGPARRWPLAALAAVAIGAMLCGCRYQDPREARISEAERQRLRKLQEEASNQRQQQRRQAMETAERAADAADKGHADEAIELYREALGSWNRMPAAYNNLGKLLLDQGDRLAAAEAFQIAAQLAPSDPRPLTNLGALWTNVGYPDDGMEHYQDALARDPNDLTALRGVIATADVLRRADEELLEHARRALSLENDQEWRDYISRQRYRIQQNLEDD